jgi:hypothetical protein
MAVDTFTLRGGELNDWKQLVESFGDETMPQRIVYLWTLDQSDLESPALGTDLLLHLVQALELTRPSTKLRIDLVTRGAQPAGRQPLVTSVEQAPSIGLLRVIFNEYPNFSCRGIDLPPSASQVDEELVWHELFRTDPEREVAFRGEARYAQRIERGRAQREQWLDPSIPLRLESRERGHLDTLRFAPFERPTCKPG